jgi:hypothetical protein
MPEEEITIEVVYASKTRQFLKSLKVATGTTVIEAILASGVSEEFPELDIASARLGIFSRFVEKDSLLNSNDRVEIYRPLIIDPKEARRQRAKKNSK